MFGMPPGSRVEHVEAQLPAVQCHPLGAMVLTVNDTRPTISYFYLAWAYRQLSNLYFTNMVMENKLKSKNK